jgi:3-hydroxyisobutyrate dehydrogenase-like beta-hydroxyacid dehydrogenase
VAISGSTPAVEAGAVTLLAGGHCAIFDRCIPLFESIAKQWFLIGPASSGVRMKLVVNLLLGVGLQALAEAISLGEHLEIDEDVLLDVLAKTAVIPPALLGKFGKIKRSDYAPEFPLRLMSKDLNLVMEAAGSLGKSLPAATAAQQCFAENAPADGDLDVSAIVPLVVRHPVRS